MKHLCFINFVLKSTKVFLSTCSHSFSRLIFSHSVLFIYSLHIIMCLEWVGAVRVFSNDTHTHETTSHQSIQLARLIYIFRMESMLFDVAVFAVIWHFGNTLIFSRSHILGLKAKRKLFFLSCHMRSKIITMMTSNLFFGLLKWDRWVDSLKLSILEFGVGQEKVKRRLHRTVWTQSVAIQKSEIGSDFW